MNHFLENVNVETNSVRSKFVLLLISILRDKLYLCCICFEVKCSIENIFTFSSVCLHVKFGQTYEIFFVDHCGVGESKDTHPHIYRA